MSTWRLDAYNFRHRDLPEVHPEEAFVNWSGTEGPIDSIYPDDPDENSPAPTQDRL